MTEALARARSLLARSRRALALAGAGLSAEAGIPTFRGEGGLWRGHDPAQLATPEAFARQPALVWEWYRWRLERVLAARPHAGHRALARLGRRRDLTVANQNVDGLLEQAWAEEGLEPQRVAALHGSIRHARCSACAARLPVEELPADPVPRCACGAPLRPDVVWFGEALEPRHLLLLEREARAADLVLALGTSAQVWPAAGVLDAARRRGVPVVVLNPDPRAGEAGDLLLAGGAALLLPQLLEEGEE
jgi:NAD-dependent deacetylase